MQTDWGGEYQKLNPFFQCIGISHNVSCPHAHQQNGSAERKHRHIVKVGLTLLAQAAMSLKFWDEAFTTAVYLINRTPNKVLNFATPLERLFHTKPNYMSLRVFRCACWPNLRPYNKHKLDFRSKQCAFLGYSSQHKGFKCLDISEGRVYISRDVVFDEQSILLLNFTTTQVHGCAKTSPCFHLLIVLVYVCLMAQLLLICLTKVVRMQWKIWCRMVNIPTSTVVSCRRRCTWNPKLIWGRTRR